MDLTTIFGKPEHMNYDQCYTVIQMMNRIGAPAGTKEAQYVMDVCRRVDCLTAAI